MAYNEINKAAIGGDLMLFVGSGSTKHPIAFSTSATLEITFDTIEISSKDSGNAKEYVTSQYGWTSSSENIYSYALTGTTARHSTDELFKLASTRELINVVFAKKTGTIPNWTIDSSAKQYTGKGYITSISLNAGNNDLASFSLSIQGTGELVMS